MSLALELYKNRNLSDEDFLELLENNNHDEELQKLAQKVTKKYYKNKIYIRGLIEVSNYCKNNCYYCGIRCGNLNVKRYRLNQEDILLSCKLGYELGFRTFVLQGGEDNKFDNILIDTVKKIRQKYPDCAITLSLGEKSYDFYKKLYDAGANRYLLRHETADSLHYNQIHPKNMLLETRQKALFDLKKIGYQVGSGFMVGSPYQTNINLLKDFRFLQKLKPAMVGIGPYLTHHDTPFNNMDNGSYEKTLKILSIIRLMFPNILIPSTTALNTINKNGRLQGILHGANVVMPNLSPDDAKTNYNLYDNKLISGNESANLIKDLNRELNTIGYEVDVARGDVKDILENS